MSKAPDYPSIIFSDNCHLSKWPDFACDLMHLRRVVGLDDVDWRNRRAGHPDKAKRLGSALQRLAKANDSEAALI